MTEIKVLAFKIGVPNPSTSPSGLTFVAFSIGRLLMGDYQDRQGGRSRDLGDPEVGQGE